MSVSPDTAHAAKTAGPWMVDPDAAPPPMAPAPSELRELAAIIRAFDESAAQLQASNEALRHKVDHLSGELARKNDALTASLIETSTLKNHLADLIEQRADGVVAIDRERRVTACNAAAAALLAQAADAPRADVPARPVGLPLRRALPPSWQALADALLRALDDDGVSPAAAEFNFDGVDGQPRACLLSASTLRDAQGVPNGAVATFRDLTAYKALEERARRNERLAALGEMAAGVAHEIRNPLGGIELFASNLRRRLPEGSAERGTCDKIIAAAAHLNRIVGDLLTFTRARDPARRPVAAGAPVRIAFDLAADRIAGKGVRATLDAAAAPGRYALDPDLLAQAFLNVVVNACDAVAQGGLLSVTVAEIPADDGGAATLRYVFADDGPGVPENARAKLFNPFFTLRRDGTGLGLAIAHRIAQDHGGSIVVGDNRPRGATFTFILPPR